MTTYASNRELRISSVLGTAFTAICLVLDLGDFTVLRSKVVLRPPVLALSMALLVVVLVLSLSLRSSPSPKGARGRLAVLCWLCVAAAFTNLTGGGGAIGNVLPLVIVFFGFRAGQSLLRDMASGLAPGRPGAAPTGGS